MLKKVVFCIPTITKPYQQTLNALHESIPLLEDANYDHYMVSEVGCPYISSARATMLRKALDIDPDVIVFIDHDVSWDPHNLVQLIDTEGDVIAGCYRFKRDEEEYMGAIFPDTNNLNRPFVRDDGCIKMHSIPAGFMKITLRGVLHFMKQFPELMFGPLHKPSIDLFNHGAKDGIWYGEDYAFSRNWRERCGDIWCIPDMNITHHDGTKDYPGNLHNFLLKQPGGSHANID